jgi:hypothetical protein
MVVTRNADRPMMSAPCSSAFSMKYLLGRSMPSLWTSKPLSSSWQIARHGANDHLPLHSLLVRGKMRVDQFDAGLGHLGAHHELGQEVFARAELVADRLEPFDDTSLEHGHRIEPLFESLPDEIVRLLLLQLPDGLLDLFDADAHFAPPLVSDAATTPA